MNEVSFSRPTLPSPSPPSHLQHSRSASRQQRGRNPLPLPGRSSSSTRFQPNNSSDSQYHHDVHFYQQEHHQYESTTATAAATLNNDDSDENDLRPHFHLGGADAEDLLYWLESQGVVLQQPERLLLSSSHHQDCPEFSDGLLLARLVGRLEGWGEEALKGIDWTPGAAMVTRLRNIKRVLEVWKRKRKGIPLHLLHREFDILEGRTDVLLPLLWHARRVYAEAEGEM